MDLNYTNKILYKKTNVNVKRGNSSLLQHRREFWNTVRLSKIDKVNKKMKNDFLLQLGTTIQWEALMHLRMIFLYKAHVNKMTGVKTSMAPSNHTLIRICNTDTTSVLKKGTDNS